MYSVGNIFSTIQVLPFIRGHHLSLLCLPEFGMFLNTVYPLLAGIFQGKPTVKTCHSWVQILLYFPLLKSISLLDKCSHFSRGTKTTHGVFVFLNMLGLGFKKTTTIHFKEDMI